MGGKISVNNCRLNGLSAKEYRKESCYILQDDQLTPFFTVCESMRIASDLKLGTSISETAKILIVNLFFILFV